jgi:hypothetical protein
MAMPDFSRKRVKEALEYLNNQANRKKEEVIENPWMYLAAAAVFALAAGFVLGTAGRRRGC